MQHRTELPHSARGADLFQKTLARLPILEHQVAQAPFMEGDQSARQPFGRAGALLFLSATDELRERPQVAAQGERLFQLGLVRLEELRALDRGIEKLRETDRGLAEGIPEEAIGILDLDKDRRGVPE